MSKAPILCAVDGERLSQKTLELAAQMSGLLQLPLVLAHAVEPIPPMMMGGPIAFTAYADAAKKAANVWIEELAAPLRKDGLEVETRILEGSATRAIVQLAKELNPTLLVLGTHGRRAPSRLLLGSVADAVALAAPCPVLIGRGDAPALREGTLKVLCAIDETAASGAAIEGARWLRERLPCDLTFANSYFPPEQITRLGLTGARNLIEPDPDIIEVLDRELRAKVGTLPGRGEISFRIGPGFGRPAETLARWAMEIGADLIVVGTHGRRGLGRIWHGSVARDLCTLSPIPVLRALPEEAPTQQPIAPPSVVVVGVDLEEGSERLVEEALALLPDGGRVVVMLAVEQPVRPVGSPALQSLGEDERAELEAQLATLLPRDTGRIRTEVLVAEGPVPGAVIQSAVERLGADTLVLGTRGGGKLARALLGSVADEALRLATCRVLVVPLHR